MQVAEHNKALERAPLTTLSLVVREGEKSLRAWTAGEWDAELSVIGQIEADVEFSRGILADTL